MRALRVTYLHLALLVLSACGPTNETPTQGVNTPSLVTPTRSTPVTTTPPPTASAIPTPGAQDAQNAVLEWLADNRGCELPCWWGVTPGLASTGALETVIAPVGAISHTYANHLVDYDSTTYLNSGATIELRDNNTLLIMYVDSYSVVGGNRIAAIHVTSQVLSQSGSTYTSLFGWKAYSQAFQRYRMSQILSAFGSPSNVLVFAEVYDPRLSFLSEMLELWLLYPRRGLLVRYDMPLERTGNRGVGCPERSFVELWLTEPTTDESFARMVAYLDGIQDYSILKSAEDALGMNANEFYIKFRGSPDECVKTPLSIWPGH